MKEQGPYILAQTDGDWFVIPAAREADFDAWVGSEEWTNGNDPAYAKRVGGSPSLVKIFSYRID